MPLRAVRAADGEMTVIEFTNPVGGPAANACRVTREGGSCFTNKNDALFRDRKSGLAKIAALAATLTGQDAEIESRMADAEHVLRVPMRKGEAPVSPTGLEA